MGVGVLARVLDVKFMRWLNISLWKLIGAGLGGRGRWGSVTNFKLGCPLPRWQQDDSEGRKEGREVILMGEVMDGQTWQGHQSLQVLFENEAPYWQSKNESMFKNLDNSLHFTKKTLNSMIYNFGFCLKVIFEKIVHFSKNHQSKCFS